MHLSVWADIAVWAETLNSSRDGAFGHGGTHQSDRNDLSYSVASLMVYRL